MPFFVDVIIPLALPRLYTYALEPGQELEIAPGKRLAVPFGTSKIYTALAYKIHQNRPHAYEAKEVHQVIDEHPLVNELQFKLWFWMAKYYLCAVGEVYRAALPGTFLLESDTIVFKNTLQDTPEDLLTDQEFLVLEALETQPRLKISEISEIVNRKKVLPLLKKMIDKHLIFVREEVRERYKPKWKVFVDFAEKFEQENELQELLETLSRAPKQRTLVLTLFSLKAASDEAISQKMLLAKSEISGAVLKSLEKKGILELRKIQVDRVQFEGKKLKKAKKLSSAQQAALTEIKTAFKKQEVVLLHGITSSGKTEIYIELIKETLAQGRQVLYILPEIALTAQLIRRLQEIFGEKVSLYHSKFSGNERVEVWYNLLEANQRTQIILGVRSSVFLPFSNLGLVIIDEEHEPSFKQNDPAPRYHARDLAIVLAGLHKAKTLMGSATPAIESYYNAKAGKYGLVTLSTRYGKSELPDIELVDIKEKRRKKQMKGHFSDVLLEKIKETTDRNEQVILFQNRRGYAPVVECQSCGHYPQCPDCDVSLTYHLHKKQLRCHYCGYHMPVPSHCVACGLATLDTRGFGTEQIEEELNRLMPHLSVGRLDLDSTRGKYGYEKIINAFERESLQVLVGTQMLTKGLDFRKVHLVGVMNADALFNFPHFKAHERSFQLLQQVAGRAGRNEKKGLVMVQTYQPGHPVLQELKANRYDQMYHNEVAQRQKYAYPPAVKIIRITFKHRSYEKVDSASEWFAQSLRLVFGENVLGPEWPSVSRIRNQYLKNVLLKIRRNQSLVSSKDHILRIQKSFEAISSFRPVRLIYNVDYF